MATQSFTIDPFLDDNTPNVLIDPVFVVGGVAAYLVDLNLSGSSIQFYTSAISGGVGTGDGPQMTSAWQMSVEAITLSRDDIDSVVVLKGPGHPDNAFVDITEPYFWTPDNGGDMQTFWDAAVVANAPVTITLDDGVTAVVPDADAPTVAIDSIANGNEGTTVQLSAVVTGGTYDELDYAWTVNDGTLDDAEAILPVWTRPLVDFNSLATISLTVTARGTGTNATDATSDTDSDSRTSAVFNIVSEAIAFDFEYLVATATLALTKVAPTTLGLSDSDDTGLDVIAKALIDAGSATILYVDANRGGTQTAGDIDANSDLTIGPDGTLITRIRILDSGARVNINDNDTPNALVLRDFFGINDAESEWTLYIQTLDGVVSSNQLGTTGDNFCNFVFTGDDITFLNSIISGERHIFKIAQATPLVPKAIEFDFTYLAVMATAAVTSRLTDHEDIEISFAYPVAMATAAVIKITAPQQSEEIEIDTTYQVLQTAVALTKIQAEKEQIAFDFAYSIPTTVLSLVKNFSKPLFGFRCDNESYLVGFCAPGSTWLACIQDKRLIGFLHSYEASTATFALRKIEVQDPKAPFYDVFKDFSLVEPRIDKVLTQYRESGKLLSMYRVYLRQIEIVAQVLENIAQVFNIERAVGHQLTLLGRRMGWPREQTLCAREPVFGFTGGKTTATPIAGFCQPFSTWSHCVRTKAQNYTMRDNYTYRKFLKVRRYQMLFLYSLKYVRLAVKELWGTGADVIRIKKNEIIVATGRLLNTDELSILALYARVLPIFPTMQVKIHVGGSNIFGFGKGYDGFCNAAEWLCPLDPEPYKCVGD